MTGPFSDPSADVDTSKPEYEEVHAVSRGMATAVAPDGGLTDVQVSLLRAVTKAVTEVDIDYRSLEPLDAAELGKVLARRGHQYRQRIVHHMVLAEMVLTPIPEDVARRVAECAEVLGIADDFVGIARKYARGALGLAWNDLRRSGFAEHFDETSMETLHSKAALEDPWEEGPPEPDLELRWRQLAELPEGSLGRCVSDMYRERGFFLPGTRSAASAYLAQHDFVHVLADYGTTMEGELEVFAFLGRADPDPKGFAWLATMIGLFETGYVDRQGFFRVDVRDRLLDNPGVDVRLADAIRRGKAVAEKLGRDLFTVDYHSVAEHPVSLLAELLEIPEKSPEAIAAGSVGPFEPAGITEYQREAGRLAAQHVSS
ncbi:MAG: hypothetical protein WD598_15440 [Acidimicrobiia bacterium]